MKPPPTDASPQQIAAQHALGTGFNEFISEEIKAKCKAAGFGPTLHNKGASEAGFSIPSPDSAALIDKARKQARKLLISQLIAGTIKAIGRRVGRDSGHQLELISQEFWQTATSLRSDYEFRTRTAHYADVMIIPQDVQTEAATTAKRLVPTEVATKKGRKNSRNRVIKALHELSKDQKFMNLQTRHLQACEVRARLDGEEQRNNHNCRGLKTESVARWIGEYFRERSNGG